MIVAARLKPADHADADHGEAEEVGDHARTGLGLERCVARPAGREPPEEQGREDHEVARDEGPQTEGLDSRVRHATSADHQRYEVVAQGTHDDRRRHHHHDRAVLAHDLDVGIGAEDVVVGFSSSVRMAIAKRPPVKKKVSTPTTYWMPTTLWSRL
jgi:hypothetical protein